MSSCGRGSNCDTGEKLIKKKKGWAVGNMDEPKRGVDYCFAKYLTNINCSN